jgi:CRISPR-associated protein Cmr1
MTPMFVGGVEPRVNDSSFPIRPTAIRGQLQFWWRATVGARYPTLAELRAAQSEVWGATDRASPVKVSAEDVRASEPKPCARLEWDQRARHGQGGWRTNWQPPFDASDSALRYAVFPFQGETPAPNRNATVTVPPAGCIEQANFRLTIRCPEDLWPRVEPAIWAWANFGGLGSRTRRGCGAIRCRELSPRDHSHLTEQLNRFAPHVTEARDWPTIGQCVLVRITEPAGDPIGVWGWLIDQFRHFRQGPGFARNRGEQNRPGRSRYPEPETIREIANLGTNRQRSGHQRMPAVPADAFPRAELGLPIVFHFKDERNGDPAQTVLYPSNGTDGKRRERMASPLILKPLALADGRAIPLVLRLAVPSLSGVDLRRDETSLRLPPSTVIRDPRLSTYGGSNWSSPLAGSPDGSALDAFLAFARSEGFTEVPR